MFPNLNAEIARKGLTQKKISEILGISITSINAKLQGKQEFKCSEMFKLSAELESEVGYLFSERVE